MKKIFKLLICLAAIVTVLSIGAVTQAKEAFDINRHDVDVVVNKDGTLDITEEMSVTFSAKRHGIYVNLPVEYKMNWIEGDKEIVKYYNFPVSNIRVLSDHKWDKETYDSFVRIKIGDGHEYANTFETYRWSYRINTRDLDLNGTQMLFLNIITSGWNTVTESTDFVIHMPQAFDTGKLQTSTPAGNILVGTGELDGLKIEVSGLDIKGSYHQTIESTEAITIQLVLDNDYFQFPDINHYGMTGLIIGSLFTLAVAVVFGFFGKDEPVITSVEFHVPAGMTSAEVGTVIDEEVNDRDVISLILDWGRRGLITINEKKKSLSLVKVRDIEADARDYEKYMFERLFKHREKVTMGQLSNSFYKTINYVKAEIEKYYNQEEKKLSTDVSLVLQYVLAFFSFIPMAALTFFSYYYYFLSMGRAVTLAIVIMVLIDICTYLAIYFYKRRYIVNTWKLIYKILITLLEVSLFGMAALIMFVVIHKTNTNVVQGISITLVQALLILLIMAMRKRTRFGNDQLGKILGLREFIVTADGERLANLAEENPYYFYDVLPYAYALGLTEVWNEHFKDLKIEDCDWYVSYRPYTDHYTMIHSLESQMHQCQRSMTSIPESSSGSGSGGGYSSGGGFSGGGGFGGSSGGSW